MSRKSIPRHRACRRLGVSVCGAVNCPLSKRPNPPGQHGGNKRQKVSPFAQQLIETQKLRAYYGLSAKQLKSYYTDAARSKSQTNIVLVQTLETRLDNIVYRMGFAASLRAARQMVVHRHINLNGKNVNKPGISINVGDQIALREKSKKIEKYKEWFSFFNHDLGYISKNESAFSGKLEAIPARDQIPILVNDHLVVEFMAR